MPPRHGSLQVVVTQSVDGDIQSLASKIPDSDAEVPYLVSLEGVSVSLNKKSVVTIFDSMERPTASTFKVVSEFHFQEF